MSVPGRVDNFLLHDHLGEGEMGAIYRATDESLGREVAIKLVRGCHLNEPDSFERLRSEARAAGKLNHPRVAQVHALNFSNGQPYLVMELVTGEDFAQKMEREGPLSEKTVLQMALDVADGLSALNREGLVHGDIKPGNIVLNRYGESKLVDFGLSGMTRIDSTGSLVGTPFYIAPELLHGGKDTHRSDLYSLGATLYHLLAGRLPHDGSSPTDILKARLVKSPTPLSKFAKHISAPTQRLIMRMLERDPHKRPEDSDAVAEAIRNALSLLETPPPSLEEEAAESDQGFDRYGERIHARSQLDPFWRRLAVAALLLAVAAGVTAPSIVKKYAVPFATAYFGLSTDAARQPARGQPATTVLPPNRQPLLPLPDADAFIAATAPFWSSTNLGDDTQGGSTMQTGGTLIIQGTGTGMWRGDDNGRFVWTKVYGDYSFSAEVTTIARNDPSSVSGLMLRGNKPSSGPSLLFGFLGSGVLFAQLRHPERRMQTVFRQSGKPVALPCHLRVVRRSAQIDIAYSANGMDWTPFAVCEFGLPEETSVGFALSAEAPHALATAKFADVRLMKIVAPPQP